MGPAEQAEEERHEGIGELLGQSVVRRGRGGGRGQPSHLRPDRVPDSAGRCGGAGPRRRRQTTDAAAWSWAPLAAEPGAGACRICRGGSPGRWELKEEDEWERERELPVQYFFSFSFHSYSLFTDISFVKKNIYILIVKKIKIII